MARLFADRFVNFLVQNSFTNHRSTVKGGGCIMFDFFVRNGIIERDEIKIKGALMQAAEQLKIYDSHNASVINRAKALYVDSIFAELKESGIPITEFLQGPIIEINKV